jgi:uncharacterized membrane protein YesL
VFGKMLNNFYYGKSGKGDYRRDDLPKNRWQLFREMLRIRLSGLFRLNLMTAIIFLPLMYVLLVICNNLLNYFIAVSETISAQTDSAREFIENSPQMIYDILFRGFLWLIPSIAVTGPVQAGMAYVTRNWSRDEHAFVWADFRDAVKGNFWQALGVSAITGLVPLVILVCWRFYGIMARGSVFFIIPQMLALALGMVWALALVFVYPMMVGYKMGFGTLLRNGFLLAVGRLPQAAAVRLAMLVPSLIALLVSFYTPYWMVALMALCGYYLLIGNGLARFVFASFSNAVFDRYINTRIAGAPVNRGLAEEEGEEDSLEGGDP